MLTLIAFLLLDEDPARAEALQHTAKAFWGVSLTTEQAIELDIGARFAEKLVDDPAIRANDLHGVAGHESRWTNAITHERNRKGQWLGDSCGVMTPFDTPFRTCAPWELTFVGGYIAGAMHLKIWVDDRRKARVPERDVRRAALDGYAGHSHDGQRPGAMCWQTFMALSYQLEARIRFMRHDVPKS